MSTINKIVEIFKLHKIVILEEIKDEETYYYFKAADVGKLLKLSNIHTSTQNFDDNAMALKKIDTNGGSQIVKFLTPKGVIRLLINSRKTKAIEIATQIGLKVKYKYIPLETQFVSQIKKAFNGDNIIEQFRVDSYMIDLYFKDYKLAIEYDEDKHRFKKEADDTREKFITEQLGCTFIRIKEGHCIFESINQIYKHIKNYSIDNKLPDISSLKI